MFALYAKRFYLKPPYSIIVKANKYVCSQNNVNNSMQGILEKLK